MQPKPGDPRTSIIPARTPVRAASPGPAPAPPPAAALVPPSEAAVGPNHPCPHCGAELVDHGVTAGPKAHARHCDACGGCWVRRDGAWTIRDGHPAPADWAGPAPPGQG